MRNKLNLLLKTLITCPRILFIKLKKNLFILQLDSSKKISKPMQT